MGGVIFLVMLVRILSPNSVSVNSGSLWASSLETKSLTAETASEAGVGFLLLPGVRFFLGVVGTLAVGVDKTSAPTGGSQVWSLTHFYLAGFSQLLIILF